MLTQEQIIAGLKKIGPCSPAALADHLQVESPALGYHLKKMLDEKSVKAAGASAGRRIALPEQEFEATDAPTPPQRRRKKHKAKHAKKPRARKPRAARTAAPKAAERFIPAVDAASRLIIVNGAEPYIFNEAQTAAIAALLFQHYDKG